MTTDLQWPEGEESLCGMNSETTGTHAKRQHFRPCADGYATIPWEMVDPAFKITAQRQLL